MLETTMSKHRNIVRLTSLLFLSIMSAIWFVGLWTVVMWVL